MPPFLQETGRGCWSVPLTPTEQEQRSAAPHSWPDLCVTSRPFSCKKDQRAAASPRRKDQGCDGELRGRPAYDRRSSLPPRHGERAGLCPDASGCRPARLLSRNRLVPPGALSPGDHRDRKEWGRPSAALSLLPPTCSLPQQSPHGAWTSQGSCQTLAYALQTQPPCWG